MMNDHGIRNPQHADPTDGQQVPAAPVLGELLRAAVVGTAVNLDPKPSLDEKIEPANARPVHLRLHTQPRLEKVEACDRLDDRLGHWVDQGNCPPRAAVPVTLQPPAQLLQTHPVRCHSTLNDAQGIECGEATQALDADIGQGGSPRQPMDQKIGRKAPAVVDAHVDPRRAPQNPEAMPGRGTYAGKLRLRATGGKKGRIRGREGKHATRDPLNRSASNRG